MYAAPRAPLPAPGEDARKARNQALGAVAAGVLGPMLAFPLAALTNSAAVFGVGFLFTVVAGAYGTAKAVRAAQLSASLAPAWVTVAHVGLGFVNLAMSCVGALVAYVSTVAFQRGRQIRVRGKALLPPVEASCGWLTADVGAPLAGATISEPERRALAGQWRENGRTEHASVAAFARLTLDLVALGAPPSLVAAAQRDALDEIRHAELCFSLARAIDGEETSPGAFPDAARAPRPSRVRTLALAELAVSSLVDGALNEGVSARIVARLARRATDPAIRALLRTIAADEGRHAAHGWDVVRFCLAEGGAPVAHALDGALRALPTTMTSTLAEGSRGGGWERWGIPGEALEAEELARTRADVVRRTTKLLAVHGVTSRLAA